MTEVAYYSLCLHTECCALCNPLHSIWPVTLDEPVVIPHVVMHCVKARERVEFLANIVREAFASGKIVLID